MLKFVGKNSLAHISHRPTLFTSLLSAFSATSPHMIVCTAHTTSLLSVTQDGTIIQRDHTLAGPVRRADILTDVSMTGHYVKHWGLVEISVRWFKGILSFFYLGYFRQYHVLNNHLHKDIHKESCTMLKIRIWDQMGGAAFGLGRVKISIPKASVAPVLKKFNNMANSRALSTPQRYFFFGSTRYYTIFCNLIRLSHNISVILWLMIGANFVPKKCEMRDMHE